VGTEGRFTANVTDLAYKRTIVDTKSSIADQMRALGSSSVVEERDLITATDTAAKIEMVHFVS